MKATPLFLGACALVSIAGAVSGAAINTSVIRQGAIGSDLIKRPAIVEGSHAPIAGGPDHYAIKTPDGVIAAEDLAQNGLYAQDRFGYRAAELEQTAAAVDAQQPAVEPAAPVGAQPAGEAPLALAEPVELAQPAADTQANGGARIIDVAAELAAR